MNLLEPRFQEAESVKRALTLLILISLVDLAITLWLIYHGHASEAHPVLRFYLLEGGLVGLTGAKLLISLSGPVLGLMALDKICSRYAVTTIKAMPTIYIVTLVGGSWLINFSVASEAIKALLGLPPG